LLLGPRVSTAACNAASSAFSREAINVSLRKELKPFARAHRAESPFGYQLAESCCRNAKSTRGRT
jgi:hypothetical protein